MSYDNRASQLRTRIIPKAICGCETAQVPEPMTHALNTAMADSISKKSKNRSQHLLCSTGPAGTDLDINANILFRRIMTLRRMIATNEQVAKTGSELVKDYRSLQFPGVLYDDTNLAELKPAPAHQRHVWTTPFPPRGGVGFVLLSMYQSGQL